MITIPKLCRLLSCVAVAVLIALPCLAQPTVLLSDAFERTTGNANPDNGDTYSDWGANDNALGGAIVQTYITTPSRPPQDGGVDQTVQEADDPANGENEGVIRYGVTAVDYNLATDPNVLAGGGYTVEFKGRRIAGGFLSFSLGTDPDLIATTSGGAAFLPVTSLNAGEHGYIYQAGDFADMRMQLFEFGSQLDPPGNIDFVTSDATAEFTTVVTVLAPDGFDVGDDLNISVTVDGNEVSAAAHTVTVAGAFPGYVAWSSNSPGALIDDLVITALGTASTLPGDANEDGVVDLLDLDILGTNFGVTSGAVWGQGDFNGDGGVDLLDLDILGANFGSTASAAVPEPAGVLLLVGLGLALPRRKH